MREIFIYRSYRDIDAIKIARYLEEKTRITTYVKENILECINDVEEYARRFASSRVHNMFKREFDSPTYGEIECEKRFLKKKIKAHGVLYDGIKIMSIFFNLICTNLKNLDKCHIILFDRLIGTYEMDKRYHARIIVCGYPSIISLQGIFEAPAKSKNYYLSKKILSMSHLPTDDEYLCEIMCEEHIDDEEKEKIEKIVFGYCMQSVFYHYLQEIFCTDKNCLLYNAHTMKEMINAQIKSGKLCERHEKMLSQFSSFNQ